MKRVNEILTEEQIKNWRHFEYYDIDSEKLPCDWLEIRLNNRTREGYEIWRDEQKMAWCGILKNEKTKESAMKRVNEIWLWKFRIVYWSWSEIHFEFYTMNWIYGLSLPLIYESHLKKFYFYKLKH